MSAFDTFKGQQGDAFEQLSYMQKMKGTLKEAFPNVANGYTIFKNAKSEATNITGIAKATTLAKGAVSGLWKVISAHPIIAATAGITALVSGVMALNKAFKDVPKNAFKDFSNNKNDYQNTLSNIESLNSELDITKSKINELEAKGSLSITEEADLNKLKLQNVELERTISLEKQKAIVQSRAATRSADAAYRAYTTTIDPFTKSPIYEENDKIYNKEKINEYKQLFGYDYDDVIINNIKKDNFGSKSIRINENDLENNAENINWLVAQYQTLQNRAKKVSNELDNIDKSGDASTEAGAKQVEKLSTWYNGINEDIEKVQNKIIDYSQDINDIYNQWEQSRIDGTLSPFAKEHLPEVEETMRVIMDILNNSSDIEKAINNIFAKSRFSGLEEKLIKTGKRGENALRKLIDTYPGLSEAMDDAGVSADKMYQHIMASANPDSLNLDNIKKQIRDEFENGDNFIGPGNKRGNFVDNYFIDKSQEEIESFYRYIRDNSLDLSKFEEEDFRYNFDIANGMEEKSKGSFLSILKDQTENSVMQQIDTVQSSISNLSDVMQKLRTGEFKESDLTDLIQTIPELYTQTDNLQEAISDFSADQLTNALTTINDAVTKENIVEPEQLKGIQIFKDALASQFDLSDININSIRSNIADAYGAISTEAYTRNLAGNRTNTFMESFSEELRTKMGRDLISKRIADKNFVDETIDESRQWLIKNSPTVEELIQEEKFKTDIEKYQKQVQILKEAKTQLQRTGKLDINTQTSLYDEWSEFIGSNDLLGDINEKLGTINNTGLSNLYDVIDFFKIIGKTEDAGALTDYVDSIIHSVRDTEINELVSTFESDISTISDAMSKLKTGEFTESDLTALIEQLPILQFETDDLNLSLSNLKADRFSETMHEINASISNATNPKEIAKLQAYKDKILNSVDLSDISKYKIKEMSDTFAGVFEGNRYQKSADIISETFMGVASKFMDTGIGKDAIAKYLAYIGDNLRTQTQAQMAEGILDMMPSVDDWTQNTLFQNNLSSLSARYQKLADVQSKVRSGARDTGWYADLLQDIPELSSETDGLSDSIANLMRESQNDTFKNLYDEIEHLRTAGRDTTGLENYVTALRTQMEQIEDTANKIGGMTIETPNADAIDAAQNKPEEGALYDKYKGYFETGKQLYDNWDVGTRQFKAIAAATSVSGASDPETFLKNYNAYSKFFTDDISGTNEFLNYLESKGLAGIETAVDGTQSWVYAFNDLSAAALQAQMPLEMFESLIGNLSDKGAINTFVSSESEGLEHLSDLYVDLATKKADLAKLKATQPGNKDGIQSLENDISNINGQITDTITGLGKVDGLTQKTIQDQIKYGADAIHALQQEREKIKDNDPYASQTREILDDQIRQLAAQYHLNPNEVESIFNATPTIAGSVESPTARQFETKEQETDYSTGVEKIQQAYADGKQSFDEQTRSFLATISKYSYDELEGYINDDGAYNVAKDAEDALDGLVAKFGLTQEQAGQLVNILQDMGIIRRTNIAYSSLSKTKEQAENAQKIVNEVTGKDYKINFDSTDIEDAKDNVEKASEQLNEFRNEDGSYNYDKQGATEAAEVYQYTVQKRESSENGAIMGITPSKVSDEYRDGVQAIQEFANAKNELDVQEQLKNQGLQNTYSEAYDKATESYEKLKQVSSEGKIPFDIDTKDLNSAEKSIQKIEKNGIETELKCDMSQLTTSLEGSTVSVQADISTEAGTAELGNIIQNSSGASIVIDAKVQGKEDVENLKEALSNVDETQSVVVNCEVTNEEDLQRLAEMQAEATSQGKDIIFNPVFNKPDDSEIKLEADTSQIDTAVTEAQSKIDSIKQGKKPTIDANNKTALNKIQEISDALSNLSRKVASPTISLQDGGTLGIINSIQNSLNSLTTTKTITINTVHHVSNTPSNAANEANGTAHANGTLFSSPIIRDYWENAGNAWANGHRWGIEHDEVALTGELGPELVVRGDSYFITGEHGAQMADLKKNDIVFNHIQTKQILENGYVTANGGRGRIAHADGTAYNVTNFSHKAFGNGSGGGHLSVTGPVSGGNSKPTQSNNSDVVSAVNKGTETTKKSGDSTNKALDDAIKKLDGMKDWIQVLLDRIDRNIAKYQNRAEKANGGKKTDKNLELAGKEIDNKIAALDKSVAEYKSHAAKVASDVKISDDLAKKVREGKINIESLSEDNKKRVEQYQKAWEQVLDAQTKLEEAKFDKLQNIADRVQNVVDTYDVVIGKREALQTRYNLKQELRVQRGQSQKPGSIYDKYMHKELYYAEEQARLGEKEVEAYKKKMKTYLKAVNGDTKDRTYQEMKKTYIELINSTLEAKIAVEELKDAIQDNTEMILQWGIDRWQRAGQKLDSVRDYKDVADNYKVTEKDYNERMKSYSNEVEAAQKLLDEKKADYQRQLANGATVSNEEMQQRLQEINDLENQIINLGASMEELKNQIMELRWEPFRKLQEELKRVTAECETLMGLLGEEGSFFNDDGSYTTNGLTNILLLQKSIESSKKQIANYRKALDDLEIQYQNGCWSEQEYIDKTNELTDGIREAATAMSGYEQQMLNMYQTQLKMENDLLQKNIDKRLEALNAKEKYYDYDKTLSKKSRDINSLKAQIAALSGAQNAASKARLERLKAELADAEEDMNDTMHQHRMELQESGYKDLSTDAEQALQNTLDALIKNTDFQKAVINNMLDQVTADYDSAYEHLGSVIDEYGIKVSDTFDQMIQKVADFNREVASVTPPSFGGMDNSGVWMGSDSAQNSISNNVNKNETVNGAGDVTFEDEIKNKAQAWYDALPGSSHYEDMSYQKASPVMQLFMSHNKGVNGKRLQKFADIVGFDFKGNDPDHPIKWPAELQKAFIKIANEYIRFAKGGIVDYGRYIPVSELNQAVKDKGEWGLAGVRRGELILNQNISKKLQDAVPQIVFMANVFSKDKLKNLNAIGQGGASMNNYGPLLNIEGNVDNDVVSRLEAIEDRIADKLFERINKQIFNDYKLVSGRK